VAASASAGGSGGMSDPAAMRQAWPQVLEAVARRSKVAWVMLQSVHVLGVEGRLLQLGFSSSGLRDNFHGSNREETLRESLSEVTGVEWKIDAIVDPSAGTAAPGPLPVASAPPPIAPTVSASRGSTAPGASASAPPNPSSGANPGPSTASTPSTSPTAFGTPGSAGPPPFAQPTTPPEEDEPDDDDEDVADAGPTARDLLVRELGATVLEEAADSD
jgi:DNA polymerase-3 subunit gamma/tau